MRHLTGAMVLCLLLVQDPAGVLGQEIRRGAFESAGLDLPFSPDGVADASDDEAIAQGVRFYGLDGSGHVVIFVIDRSQSMAGIDLVMAKREVLRSIEALSSEIEFGLVLFNAERIDKFPRRGRPAMAEPGNKVAARSFVEAVTAAGGTCAGTALVAALRMADQVEKGPATIFYLGDGMTNCSRDKTQAEYALSVLNLVRAKNAAGHTIHTITLGKGSDQGFARALATQNGGIHHHVD